MEQYIKINSLYKRTPDGKKMLFGEFSQPEFEYLYFNNWVLTEKVDGTNVRVMFDGYKINFGGKTDNAQMPTPLFAKLTELFTYEKMNMAFPGKLLEDGSWEQPSVCLYGEGFGAGIQRGGCYIPNGVSFVLFDIKAGNWWLKREDVEDIATNLGIQIVPIVDVGTLELMEHLCAPPGFQSQWGGFIAEGIVARPEVELFDRAGHRIITKLKCKDFGRK